MGVAIDWSLRLGDVVSAVFFAGSGVSVIFLMKSDIRAIGLRLGFLEDTVKKETGAQNAKIDKQSEEIARLGEVLNVMGRYEERMLMLRRDMDDLRHGRGYVLAQPAKESG